MANQIGARMVFENARALAASQGFGLQAAKCTQSYIRSEAAVTTTTAQYNFPVIVSSQTSATQRVNNRLLNLQDLFYISQVGIFLTDASSTSGTGRLYTYPNPVVFGGSGAYNSVYNGALSITINNEQVLPSWDVNRHLWVGQTQQNTNFNVASTTSPAVFNNDQYDGSESGFYPCEPGIILNGAANIVCNLNLPAAVSTLTASNPAIVVLFRGILIQNATSVR
jgi:hypothetical protein